jgi:hypothetical protein
MSDRTVDNSAQSAHTTIAQPRPESPLWQLLMKLRTNPTLQTWVTMESVPLIPKIDPLPSGTRNGITALVSVLLVTRKANSYSPPWGMVVFAWPTGKLIGLKDLRALAEPLAAPPESLLATPARLAPLDAYLAELPNKREPDGDPLLQTLYQSAIPLFDGMPTKQTEESQIQGKASGATNVVPRKASLPYVVDEIGRLLKDAHLDSLYADWLTTRRLLSRPQFSVVITGEFSRGKTTLLNRLIGRNLLPVGDLPTTRLPNTISFAPEERASVVRNGGLLQRISLNELSAVLSIDGPSNDHEAVHIQLPLEWLSQGALQIVDTPGIGDGDLERTQLALGHVSTADAALVTISATLPLSQTERELIYQHVLSHGTPRVAIVVTRVDQLPEEERALALTSMRARLGDLQSSCELWVAAEPDELNGIPAETTSGVKAIRAKLIDWARSPDHRALRARQISVQVRSLAEQAQDTMLEKIEAARFLTAATEIEKRNIIEAIERDQVALETEISLFQSNAVNVVARSRKSLEQHREAVTANMAEKILDGSDAAHWWNERAPAVMQQALNKGAQLLEKQLTEQLDADMRRLIAHFSKSQLDTRWTTSAKEPVPAADVQSLQTEHAENLNRKALPVRIAGATAIIGAALLITAPLSIPAGMLAAPAGIAFAYFSSESMKKSKNKQRQKLLEELTRLLQDSFTLLANQHAATVHERYRHSAELARAAVHRKLAEQRALIESEKPTTSTEIAQLEELHHQLTQALAQLPATRQLETA